MGRATGEQPPRGSRFQKRASALQYGGIATRTGTHEVEERFLHEIISTVGSSLDLEEVLDGVVRLLSDASAVHACFVYLLERDRKRLVLRAASAPYARSRRPDRAQARRGARLVGARPAARRRSSARTRSTTRA